MTTQALQGNIQLALDILEYLEVCRCGDPDIDEWVEFERVLETIMHNIFDAVREPSMLLRLTREILEYLFELQLYHRSPRDRNILVKFVKEYGPNEAIENVIKDLEERERDEIKAIEYFTKVNGRNHARDCEERLLTTRKNLDECCSFLKKYSM